MEPRSIRRVFSNKTWRMFYFCSNMLSRQQQACGMDQVSTALRRPQRLSRDSALNALRDKISRFAHCSGRDRPTLVLGAPEVEEHLPVPGLACGTLHEVVAKGHGDRPGAFGFAFAVMASALTQRPGHAFFIASCRALRDFGRPFGDGLRQLGADPARVVMVETVPVGARRCVSASGETVAPSR